MRVAWTVSLSCPLGRDANVWAGEEGTKAACPVVCMGSPLQTAIIHSFAAHRHHIAHRITGSTDVPLTCCAVLCYAGPGMDAVPRWVARCALSAASCCSLLAVELFPSLRQTGGGEKANQPSHPLDPNVNVLPVYK